MGSFAVRLAGYMVLVILLSAGAAQSLAGGNTVFGDDIVDGQVGYPDIKDSAVGSKKILDNSVTGADIATGAVTDAEIRDGAVSSADLLDDSVSKADLATDSVGRSELDFEPISNVVRVEQAGAISGGLASGVHAFCPASSPVVLGGGYKWGFSGEAGFTLWSSLPFAGGWVVWGQNATQQSKSLTVYAICGSDGD